jgi:hypothetical protein
VSAWARGRAEVGGFLDQGELDVVAASDELAGRLLDDGERAVASARLILDSDPGGSLTLAYDAARKAATSLLTAQGLRPTIKGGHRVVQDAVAAQFNGPFMTFGRIRRKRHEHQYPSRGSAPATGEDAMEVIDFAARCIDASRELLGSGRIGPWRG